MIFEELFGSSSVREILNSYDFPHRFVVYFIAQCSKDVLQCVKCPDSRSLKAIEIAERFGNGEDFSKEEINKVYNDVKIIRDYTVNSSNFYLVAVYLSIAIDYIENHRVANYIVFNSYSLDNLQYKSILFELIKTRMSTLEKVMAGWDKL